MCVVGGVVGGGIGVVVGIVGEVVGGVERCSGGCVMLVYYVGKKSLLCNVVGLS